MINRAELNHRIFPSLPWLFVLAGVVIFFIVSISTAYRSIKIMTGNNQTVASTLQTIALIKQLKTELLRAESGQRGYLLTSDMMYLEPYNEALTNINHLLSSLSATTTELPQQKARFERLYRLSQAKLDEMRKTVQFVHNDKNRAAVTIVNTNEGISLMQEIFKLIDEMEVDERQLLNINRINADNNRKFIMIVFFVTNAIGLLLALGVYIVVFRNARRIAQLYAEIERTNIELETRVEERTQTLSLYAEELQRSNRDLEEFAFVASHDLQEPLRKIRAFGDRLMQKYSEPLGDRGADYIKRMHSASERMSILIDDLLSFSRLSTQQEPFEMVDMNSVIEQVLDDFEFALEEAGAKLDIDSLPIIEADRSQIAQVFMNLIGNSLKFRKKEVPPEITIRCELLNSSEDLLDEREWCTIKFTDNGIGFEEQYVDRVFSLFQRLHRRDEYSGTGIGLALCRKIVNRHGGTISASSEPGLGTEFSIRIPLTQQAVQFVAEDVNEVQMVS